jgi:hypothetical protein
MFAQCTDLLRLRTPADRPSAMATLARPQKITFAEMLSWRSLLHRTAIVGIDRRTTPTFPIWSLGLSAMLAAGEAPTCGPILIGCAHQRLLIRPDRGDSKGTILPD